MVIPTSASIYQGDGFRDLMSLIQVSVMLSDTFCVQAVVASASYHLAAIKSNAASRTDWKVKEDVKQEISNAEHHMSLAVRLLNERLEDPEQALSTVSIFGTAYVALSMVSRLNYSSLSHHFLPSFVWQLNDFKFTISYHIPAPCLILYFCVVIIVFYMRSSKCSSTSGTFFSRHKFPSCSSSTGC